MFRSNNLSTDLITDLALYFETVRSAAWCKEHQFSNVALQFPDTLLAYAPQVKHCVITNSVPKFGSHKSVVQAL